MICRACGGTGEVVDDKINNDYLFFSCQYCHGIGKVPFFTWWYWRIFHSKYFRYDNWYE